MNQTIHRNQGRVPCSRFLPKTTRHRLQRGWPYDLALAKAIQKATGSSPNEGPKFAMTASHLPPNQYPQQARRVHRLTEWLCDALSPATQREDSNHEIGQLLDRRP